MTNDEFIVLLHELNPSVEPLEEFKGKAKKILCRCKNCNHQWAVTPSNLFRGRSCPPCSKKAAADARRKTQEQFENEVAEVLPDVEVLGKYRAINCKIEFRCKKCGYEWMASPSEILIGRGCPSCRDLIRDNDWFVKHLCNLNPTVEPLQEYMGYKQKILCRCKICNFQWSTTAGTLLSGRKCPECGKKASADAKRKTKECFIAEVAAIMPDIEVLGEYKTSSTKILLQCKKCDMKWMATPTSVLSRHGCPSCGGSMKWDNDKFVSELKRLNPYIMPLENYTNARTPILCQCLFCKHTWKAIPNKILYETGCPNCSEKSKTSFPEQAIYFYISQIFPDAINRYREQPEIGELDIFIPEIQVGIEYDGVFWHKNKISKEQKKYNACTNNHITLYRIKEETADELVAADALIIRHEPYTFTTLDSSIIELFQLLGITTDIDTERDALQIREQYYHIRRENSLFIKAPEIAAEWHPDKNGGIRPDMVPYGSNEKYWWRCPKCQYEWATTVADRACANKGCPRCAAERTKQKLKKSNEQFIEELAQKNPNIYPIEKYKNAHEKIRFRCRICGNEWAALPLNILRGRDCPKCAHKRRIQRMTETKRKQQQERLQQTDDDKNCKTL